MLHNSYFYLTPLESKAPYPKSTIIYTDGDYTLNDWKNATMFYQGCGTKEFLKDEDFRQMKQLMNVNRIVAERVHMVAQTEEKYTIGAPVPLKSFCLCILHASINRSLSLFKERFHRISKMNKSTTISDLLNF